MIQIENINGRRICIAGIGKLFYQEGLPISIAMAETIKVHRCEISVLHIADELLKKDWTADRVIKTIEAATTDDVDGAMKNIDLSGVRVFCYSSYERQREMLFDYMFGSRSSAVSWLNNQLKK